MQTFTFFTLTSLTQNHIFYVHTQHKYPQPPLPRFPSLLLPFFSLSLYCPIKLQVFMPFLQLYYYKSSNKNLVFIHLLYILVPQKNQKETHTQNNSHIILINLRPFSFLFTFLACRYARNKHRKIIIKIFLLF